MFHFDLQQCLKFNHIDCNQFFSFEPELFPAALISKWHPAHITLFVNGKGMITGIKDRDTAVGILNDLKQYIATDACCH